MNCFLCGSPRTHRVDYLRLNSKSMGRNFAYAVPRPVAHILGRVSDRFARTYAPVAVNKRHFDRNAYYCLECRTGWAHPFLSEQQLDDYYGSFYWSHRSGVDDEHAPKGDRPSDTQMWWSISRVEWLSRFVNPVQSALDFGAGDCAGGFVLMKQGVARTVHVVDPSEQTRALAQRYGQSASSRLDDAPSVDLLYSAHSIEHVADLRRTMAQLLEKVKPGGYLFFETPNIADRAVFDGIVFTPHTYMLSLRSFEQIAQQLSLQLVAAVTFGPSFSKSEGIPSEALTDLRVLLRKA